METFYLTTLRAEDTDFQASCTTTIAILNQLPDQIGLKALRSNKPILNLISDCYTMIGVLDPL
jgi:hypothetical protein